MERGEMRNVGEVERWRGFIYDDLIGSGVEKFGQCMCLT
jgi:hypothetical protein